MQRKSLKKIILYFLSTSGIILQLQFICHAAESEILYDGFPPSGEQYYTACIACSNLDSTSSEEIVITDDFGAFQILYWDNENNNFIEKWVSDPVFENQRITRIFTPPSCDRDASFLVFADSKDDLRIFQLMEYFVKEIGVIHLQAVSGYEWISDFIAGEFINDQPGWEIITLRTYTINSSWTDLIPSTISIGQFNPELRQFTTVALTGINPESYLDIDHQMCAEQQSIIIVSEIEHQDGMFRIIKSPPPYKNCQEFLLEGQNITKTGWSGEIDSSGIPVLSCFIRDQENESKISFYTLDKSLKMTFSVPVPENTSKWTLGDIDGNGLRELIVLDFLGRIIVIDFHKLIEEKALEG